MRKLQSVISAVKTLYGVLIYRTPRPLKVLRLPVPKGQLYSFNTALARAHLRRYILDLTANPAHAARRPVDDRCMSTQRPHTARRSTVRGPG